MVAQQRQCDLETNITDDLSIYDTRIIFGLMLTKKGGKAWCTTKE